MRETIFFWVDWVNAMTFYSLSQISQWKLEEIAPNIIDCWKNGLSLDGLSGFTHPNWDSPDRHKILKLLVKINEGDEIWIGIPVEIKMGFETRHEVLKF